MNKSEHLQTDVRALQKIIVNLTVKKEKLEADVKDFHQRRKAAVEELSRPIPGIEASLKMLRIESESLAVQIEARKKELAGLSQLHTTQLEHHGKLVSTKKEEHSAVSIQIDTKKEELAELERSLAAKHSEIESLTRQIATLRFEVLNYQKTIALITNQEKELIYSIRIKVDIEKKLIQRIRELKRTHHIVVEDVLTERNKRLWARHQQYTGMNQALDTQIEQKRKKLK